MHGFLPVTRGDLLSVIVIGRNESANLPRCFASIREMRPVPGLATEVIYVDGGSDDDSMSVVRSLGMVRILGGEKPRRAAENRNIGMREARGAYIQFLDGDMTLDPEWCVEAYAYLLHHPGAAAVCGNLLEARESVIHQAQELDWGAREGDIRHCGGAAFWRTEVLAKLGGFPEQVRYGEEPYLCWRVRNELHLTIHQMNRTMATHDLGHDSFGDYWRRCTRTGRAYAEIADRFARTDAPLWLRESRMNVLWAIAIVGCFALPALVCRWWAFTAWILLAGVIARKAWQVARHGKPPRIALVYAAHTYFSKIPLALGELLWAFDRLRARMVSSSRRGPRSPGT